MKCFYLPLLLPAILSCKPRSEFASAPKAFVTKREILRAVEIIRETKDWIPYNYSKDGCYLRSRLMSSALAAEGIASSAQIIKAGQFDLTLAQEGLSAKQRESVMQKIRNSIRPIIEKLNRLGMLKKSAQVPDNVKLGPCEFHNI